ncbi:hypothetical protein A9Q75_01515 [Colwellia psychrerythraea]|uniref:Shedu protein SduA C-terminal domain-containing protein n=1 Tax=Colwellia psychrerythraea TaxID=28229 RepID=A0A1Y5EPY8_COLPS|nr:hypothetical protein A9Q75_01515 [Colwellia psychrerythraea]
MIHFEIKNTQLQLIYQPDNSDVRWIDGKLKNDGEVSIGFTFRFNSNDLISADDEERVFVLGVSEDNCYRIKSRILGTEHDVLLSKKLNISRKTFIAQRNISVLSKIDRVLDEPIIISDDILGALPINEFNRLLSNFPTSTELKHYAGSRITGVLKDYFETTSDAQEKLDKFLNKKKDIRKPSKVKWIYSYEEKKYQYIRDTFVEMLKDANSFTEKEWQKQIAEFLLLIFPKYIAVIENVPVKDYYTNPKKVTDRYIDIALVDANGNIDIIEVKKPFDSTLLYSSTVRDNYVPKRELSATVIQVEKYLFHLSKNGREGEKRIRDKYINELPKNIKINITNPKGMLILGRDEKLDEQQKFDFEIIKRKYANVMDIMTYDDILRRLDNIIEKYTSL